MSQGGHGALRAFDKAVWTKPPVVAADAGLMQIQLWEGSVSRCAEVVRQSTTDTIVVTPRNRVSLQRFKFPAVFSHSYGSVSEINVTCDVYVDDFGLEYWIASRDFPSHRKGDLLMIHYGSRRAQTKVEFSTNDPKT